MVPEIKHVHIVLFLKFISIFYNSINKQAAISWRASDDRQISLSASTERAFANFRDKKHCILQWQIFATKTMPALALAAPHKHYESCASIDSPVIALATLS